jgi:hypothetical protein
MKYFSPRLRNHRPPSAPRTSNGACGGDQALRALVQGLLKAHESAGSFLDEPHFEATPSTEVLPNSDMSANSVGPYKLLEQTGEGGFGIVYMAEQQQPVRRKVKPGMDTKQVVTRFEMYLRILAKTFRPSSIPSPKTSRFFSRRMAWADSLAISTAVSTDIPASAARMACGRLTGFSHKQAIPGPW